MPDNSVDLTLTDIPYGEVNLSEESGLRKLKKGKADEMTFNLLEFMEEVYRITRGTITIFCGQRQMSSIVDYYYDLHDLYGKKHSVRQIVWIKANPSPLNGQYGYLSGVENGVMVKKQGATFNAFCKINAFRHPTGSSEMHPTEKNHNLLAELIADNSNVGDLVFDPCAGSGSTLLVAHNMGRRYIGCELDETFYKAAKKRLDTETAQMNLFDYIKEG